MERETEKKGERMLPRPQFHVIPAHDYIVVGAGVSLTAIRDNFN